MSRGSWIQYRGVNPHARVRLFCYPHAGGSASAFIPWRPTLPESVELCPIEPPGRWTRRHDPLVRRVEQLADELAAELESYTDLPYVLLGHSLGSLVMFEVAKRLEARNRPTQLVVTACGAPQRRTGVYRLGDDAMLERIGILYGTKKMAPLADPELRARFLPVIRADLEAFDTYAFSGTASLAIPLSAYGGRRDALVAEERVQGWKTQTRGPFRCTFLDGDHFFIHEPASGFRKHLIPILEEAATERT